MDSGASGAPFPGAFEWAAGDRAQREVPHTVRQTRRLLAPVRVQMHVRQPSGDAFRDPVGLSMAYKEHGGRIGHAGEFLGSHPALSCSALRASVAGRKHIISPYNPDHGRKLDAPRRSRCEP